MNTVFWRITPIHGVDRTVKARVYGLMPVHVYESFLHQAKKSQPIRVGFSNIGGGWLTPEKTAT
jgi:hypothetical protein